MTNLTEMKPCAHCGKPVDLTDNDTLYPNGAGYEIIEDGLLAYKPFREVPETQWCYSMHCPVTSGGCGLSMPGNSRQEAIDKWNKRA